MTTVFGRLSDVSGAGVEGTVTAVLMPLSEDHVHNGSSLVGGVRTLSDLTGDWTLSLISNDLVSPAGSYYKITLQGAEQDIVYVQVPDQPDPISLDQITPHTP